MVPRICLLVILYLLSAGPALALDFSLDEELAIGMAAPSPTGISIKKWTDGERALDMFYEWSSSHRRVVVHADLLTHDFQALELESGHAPIYYGFGVRAKTQEGKASTYGIRIPLGVVMMLESWPLEFFGELGPRSDLIPKTTFAVDVMIGIRYRILP